MKKFFFGLMMLSLSSIYAAPKNPTVQKGTLETFQSDHNTFLKVADKTIIHWDEFSIDKQELVKFVQHNPSSIVLNRVTGTEISNIAGTLEGNGHVYLLNPNGILIGPSGRIDCAGFLASTLSLSDKDFLNQKALHFNANTSGSIINYGRIRTHYGDIYLISKTINNKGLIEAASGNAHLITTTKVIVKPHESENILLNTTTGDDSTLDQSGVVHAINTTYTSNGNLYALAIKHEGTTHQYKIQEKDGRVFITAPHGKIQMKGKTYAHEGSINIAAKEIDIDEAIIDTSGSKGGSIAIGSKGTQTLNVSKNCAIHANGLVDGDGGYIEFCAAKSNHVMGLVQAKSVVGNGGKVKMTADGSLKYFSVDLTSASKKTGHFIIDPKNIIVVSGGPDSAGNQTFDHDPSEDVSIAGSTIQSVLATANVTLQANTDITISDTISSNSGNALTLQAGRSINFTSTGNIALTNANFSATINDENAIAANRDPGTAQFTMAAGSTIATNGGNVTIQYDSFGGSSVGEVRIDGASTSINTGNGDINLHGRGRDNNSKAYGISLTNTASLQGNTISLTGIGGDGTNYNHGIYVSNSTVRSANGSIVINGTGGSGTNSLNAGFVLDQQGIIQSTGSATISITGTGGQGTDHPYGIWLLTANSTITSVDGIIQLKGTGGNAAGPLSSGICIDAGTISSTGSTPISIFANGGIGFQSCPGLAMNSEDSKILSTGNDITINATGGTASYGSCIGINISESALIQTSGSGTINVNATGGQTGINCLGLFISEDTSAILSQNGDINITALKGNNDTSQNYYIEDGNSVRATGSGHVNINSNN